MRLLVCFLCCLPHPLEKELHEDQDLFIFSLGLQGPVYFLVHSRRLIGNNGINECHSHWPVKPGEGGTMFF